MYSRSQSGPHIVSYHVIAKQLRLQAWHRYSLYVNTCPTILFYERLLA